MIGECFCRFVLGEMCDGCGIFLVENNMFGSYLILCLILLLNYVICVCFYNFVFFYINDVYVYIEEMNKYVSGCKVSDRDKGECYGGVVWRVIKINEIWGMDFDYIFLLDVGD